MTDLLSLIKFKDPDTPPVKLAITGGVHAGKTTRALYWIQQFRTHGIACHGCLEIAVFDDDGIRIGYDFEDISTGERRSFARRTINKTQGIMTRYCFDETVWPWFENAYDRADLNGVYVFDELGLLEANGGGMMPVVKRRLESDRKYLGLLCVCRESVIEAISQQLSGFDAIESLTKET